MFFWTQAYKCVVISDFSYVLLIQNTSDITAETECQKPGTGNECVGFPAVTFSIKY